MAHWVTCKYCGQKFDADKKKAYYTVSSGGQKRYICKKCHNLAKKNVDPNTAPKSPSWFSQHWMILFGGLLAFGGIGNFGVDLAAAFLGLISGGVLIFLYFRKRRKAAKRVEAELQMQAELDAQAAEAERQAQAAQTKVCTGCGAVNSGLNQFCEYCGTKLQ